MSSFPNQRVDQSWGGGEPQDPTRARPTQPELINPRAGFYKIKPQSEFLQSLFWSCFAEYYNKKLGLIRKHCQRHNGLGILNLQLDQLALVNNLAIRWRHLSDINCKFGHQVTPLTLPHCLILLYLLHRLVSSSVTSVISYIQTIRTHRSNPRDICFN